MQKFWNVITVLVVVSLVSACAREVVEQPRIRDDVAEAAVYSALINQELAIPLSYINMEETIFIVNRTYETTCYICYEHISDDSLYNISSSLGKDTVKDFRAVNQEAYALNLRLSINEPYQYIDEPSPDNWATIGQKDGGVLVVTMLSRVGFNEGMDQALVYMAHRCGTECGVGVIYFLVQEGDAWQVESEINAWHS